MSDALNNAFTRWWDFVDSRGVVRRLVLGFSLVMLWDAAKWGMAYADSALAMGKTDASIAAIMAAAGAPATLLAGYVFKQYLESRAG
jgi:hypothetical protein